MALFEKRKQALNLRRQGQSIVVIARKLAVAKSTVSIWCRDLELTKAQKERLQENSVIGGHRGRLLGAEANRQKKLTVVAGAVSKARTEILGISEKNLFFLSIALYWAEGTKQGSSFIPPQYLRPSGRGMQ